MRYERIASTHHAARKLAVDSRLNEISGDIDSVQKSVTDTKERIMENEDKWKRIYNINLYNVAE